MKLALSANRCFRCGDIFVVNALLHGHNAFSDQVESVVFISVMIPLWVKIGNVIVRKLLRTVNAVEVGNTSLSSSS